MPEFEKRWNRYARPVGDSWRVDETYLKVRGQWVYLYRAVDNAARTGSKRFETTAVTIRRIELTEKIKKRQVNLKSLTGKATTAPERWAAVLAA